MNRREIILLLWGANLIFAFYGSVMVMAGEKSLALPVLNGVAAILLSNYYIKG